MYQQYSRSNRSAVHTQWSEESGTWSQQRQFVLTVSAACPIETLVDVHTIVGVNQPSLPTKQ